MQVDPRPPPWATVCMCELHVHHGRPWPQSHGRARRLTPLVMGEGAASRQLRTKVSICQRGAQKFRQQVVLQA